MMRHIDPDYLDNISPTLEEHIKLVFPEATPQEMEQYVIFTAGLIKTDPSTLSRDFYEFMRTGSLKGVPGEKLDARCILQLGCLYLTAIEYQEPGRTRRIFNNVRKEDQFSNPKAAVCAAAFLGKEDYLRSINDPNRFNSSLIQAAEQGLRNMALYQQNHA